MNILVTTKCDECCHHEVCKLFGGPEILKDELISLAANANKDITYTNCTVDIACPHYKYS